MLPSNFLVHPWLNHIPGLFVASKELTTGSVDAVAKWVAIGRGHSILPGWAAWEPSASADIPPVGSKRFYMKYWIMMNHDHSQDWAVLNLLQSCNQPADPRGVLNTAQLTHLQTSRCRILWKCSVPGCGDCLNLLMPVSPVSHWEVSSWYREHLWPGGSTRADPLDLLSMASGITSVTSC